MKFQQIRSATAIVTFGGSRFLIDPWLAPKPSCTRSILPAPMFWEV